MPPIEEVLAEPPNSDFRRRFRLRASEPAYLRSHGLATVLEHTADFVARRPATDETGERRQDTATGNSLGNRV